jgi:hypothetical protein
MLETESLQIELAFRFYGFIHWHRLFVASHKNYNCIILARVAWTCAYLYFRLARHLSDKI